ncbi:MAG: lipoprotein-releasing ABC transporter permease subunit [Gammaproteobacteria bacterium]|nr:MAG: lipoprotein-releasing ABC transporter permease subunit [Gammaproteobacteria bacterium]
MFRPLELFIGLRYTKAKRRSQIVSFISLVSTIGITLGVIALITVLSVMNGFEAELKSRILGVVSHVTIESLNNQINNWEQVDNVVNQNSKVTSTSPYISGEVMVAHKNISSGAAIRGILPQKEADVSDVLSRLVEGSADGLVPKSYKILIGTALAEKLGVGVGDKITLVEPNMQVSAVGLLPRMKRFTVAGIFNAGMYTFDLRMIIMHMSDASRFMRMKSSVTGIRVKTIDINDSYITAYELRKSLGSGFWSLDWSRRNRNLFSAIKLQKKVMFIILALVVGVAAFNLISTLIMTVNDKKGDIAILRTLGFSRKGILKIFIIQGAMIGIVGIVFGTIFGVLLSVHISSIASLIEQTLGIELMVKDIYMITQTLPSTVLASDVFAVAVVSFILTLLATIYPSMRAMSAPPAEALRYE